MGLTAMGDGPCLTNATAAIGSRVTECLIGQATTEACAGGRIIAALPIATIRILDASPPRGLTNIFRAAMGVPTVGDRPGFAGATTTISPRRAAFLKIEAAAEMRVGHRIVAALAVATVTVLCAGLARFKTNVFAAAVQLTAVGDGPCFADPTAAIGTRVTTGRIVETATEARPPKGIVAALTVAAIGVLGTRPIRRQAHIPGTAVQLPTVTDRPRLTGVATTVCSSVTTCLKGETATEAHARAGIVATLAVTAVTIGNTRTGLG